MTTTGAGAENSAPIRAAVYLRISKDKTGLRAGVERQRDETQALAERLGWPVVRVYTDNDISAYSGKRRPDYQALCADIADGTVNAVIAWHPDRLHRRSAELESWLTLVGDDVQHATCQAGLWDLSTPSGRMNARVVGAVGQYESEHRSERVKAAKAVDARNGRFNGGNRCYGYESDGMRVYEDEAVEVRRIADAVVKGVSLRSLARELNGRGVPTTAALRPVPLGGGKHGWTQAKLRGVMLSPRVAGYRAHREGTETKLYRGQWPPIIDATTYEAMRSILEDPKRRTPGPRMGRTPTTLGTGLYICGDCGGPMRKSKATRGWPIYRCGGSITHGGKHVSRRADTLDAFVTDALIGRLSQPGFVQAMADRVNADGTAGHAALITERDEIRAALDELAQAAESGAVTAKLALTLARQTRELTERADEISHLLAQAGSRSPVADLIGADDIEAAWHALSLPVQRAILVAVMTVTVHRGKKGPKFDPTSIALAYN